MLSLYSLLTVAGLTIFETGRRRILWVGVVMGTAFLAIFALGFHFIFNELEAGGDSELNREFGGGGGFGVLINVLRSAGLYAVYFLAIALSALISVNTISGELESHTMDTMVTKPIPRWSIIGGKWLGLAVIVTLYLLFMAGGVILIVYWRSGAGVRDVPAGLAMMVLGSLSMLSVAILGGTRLSTLANGALAFMLYGLALIGGWVETFGSMLRNEVAVDIGIISSLLMPADILWRQAAVFFNPAVSIGPELAGPFTIASQPSGSMTVYSLLYIVGLLVLACWAFTRRDL